MDAVTDVPGVKVGHATLIAARMLVVGHGPGAHRCDVVVPCENIRQEPLFAGYTS